MATERSDNFLPSILALLYIFMFSVFLHEWNSDEELDKTGLGPVEQKIEREIDNIQKGTLILLHQDSLYGHNYSGDIFIVIGLSGKNIAFFARSGGKFIYQSCMRRIFLSRKMAEGKIELISPTDEKWSAYIIKNVKKELGLEEKWLPSGWRQR